MKTRLSKHLAICLLVIAASPTPSALAQPSSASSISFQGALTGAGGQPLPNGSYTLGFQFWDHPTGAAASNRVGGAVTVPGVAVSGGVASTAIPVQPDWFNGQTRYLGTTIQGVNAGQELLPRVLVTAVPYAIGAQSLGPGAVNVGSNGFVGIGTTSPKKRLHVVGDYYGNTIWLHAREGDGGSGTAYVQARDDSANSSIDLQFRTQLNGVFRESLRLTATDDVKMPGHLFLRSREGEGQNGTAYIQGRDSSGSSDIDLQFRTQQAGTILDILRLNSNGNVGVGLQNPATRLEINGTTRTTVLQITSARAAKQGFVPVDTAAVLAKVAALPIATWAYTNSHGVRHLGPVAEDFHAAFALGDSTQHIATVDADGVALAAIQGLHQLVTAQQTALHARESEAHTLRERLEKLERLVTELAGQRKEEGK